MEPKHLGHIAFLFIFSGLLVWLVFYSKLLARVPDDLSCLKIHDYHIKREKYLLSSPLKVGFKLHSSGCITEYTHSNCLVILSQTKHSNGTSSDYYLKSQQGITITKKSIQNNEFQIEITPVHHDHSNVDKLPKQLNLDLTCNSKNIESVTIPLSTQIFSEQVFKAYRKNNPELNHVNILIAGNVGSGKSTLVNSFYTCVTDRVKFTVPALVNNNHTTIELNKLRLNVMDYSTDSSITSNITILDTVGITKYNYNSKEAIELILSGENPNIYLEGNIKRSEIDIKLLEERLRELAIVFELKTMSTEEEYLLNLFFAHNTPEHQQKLQNYVKNNDWNSYIEKRKKEIKFKKDNLDKLADLELEYNTKDAIVKQNKVLLNTEKEKFEKGLANKKMDNKINNKVHAIVLLVSQPSIDSDHLLQDSIKNFIKEISIHGIYPIIGVTHLSTNNESIVIETVKKSLGFDANNIFLVPFNTNKEKNFEVDKKILSLLLEAITRGNDFKEQRRSQVKDEL
ncbi:predicted protein [Naegleria gruberi]|uniref:Predicted protein n=1 Tax=Naegleria gruberi TaxID=5762 RepID=D2VBP1_NAEGR|nr:uncharacterized protein NAEGRDRAFT_66284 [Naegleria gruberi]EFC45830.1 predicted protein [Naegleria gruberi]|eukprot:XP_002678574.1 predicted protein [Naegleria gruberi strain NEG-M]